MKKLNGSRSQKTNGVESNDIMAKVDNNLQSLTVCSAMIPYSALATVICANSSLDGPLKTCGVAVSAIGTILTYKKSKAAANNLRQAYLDLAPPRREIKNLNNKLNILSIATPIVSPIFLLSFAGMCSSVVNPDLNSILSSVTMTGLSLTALYGLGITSASIENNFRSVITNRVVKSK